jgi:hypothetical protein
MSVDDLALSMLLAIIHLARADRDVDPILGRRDGAAVVFVVERPYVEGWF